MRLDEPRYPNVQRVKQLQALTNSLRDEVECWGSPARQFVILHPFEGNQIQDSIDWPGFMVQSDIPNMHRLKQRLADHTDKALLACAQRLRVKLPQTGQIPLCLIPDIGALGQALRAPSLVLQFRDPGRSVNMPMTLMLGDPACLAFGSYQHHLDLEILSVSMDGASITADPDLPESVLHIDQPVRSTTNLIEKLFCGLWLDEV